MIEQDLDLMQDVYMSKEQRAAYERIAEDAKRWEHARKLLTIYDIESAHEAWEALGRLTSEYECQRADVAIDKAIAHVNKDNQP